MVCSVIGEGEGCVEALRSSLEALPSHAPAILSLGSVEYQLDRPEEGRRLLMSLLDLPDDAAGLTEIIDKAGDFVISIRVYAGVPSRPPTTSLGPSPFGTVGCCRPYTRSSSHGSASVGAVGSYRRPPVNSPVRAVTEASPA